MSCLILGSILAISSTLRLSCSLMCVWYLTFYCNISSYSLFMSILSSSILSPSFSSEWSASLAHFYYAVMSWIRRSSFFLRSSILCSRKSMFLAAFLLVASLTFQTCHHRSFLARSMTWASFSSFWIKARERLRTSFKMTRRS